MIFWIIQLSELIRKDCFLLLELESELEKKVSEDPFKTEIDFHEVL